MAEQRHTNAHTQIHIQRRRRRKNTRIWCCAAAAVCCFFTSHRKSPLSSTYANFSSPLLCFLRAFFASCFTPPSTNLLLFNSGQAKTLNQIKVIRYIFHPFRTSTAHTIFTIPQKATRRPTDQGGMIHGRRARLFFLSAPHRRRRRQQSNRIATDSILSSFCAAAVFCWLQILNFCFYFHTKFTQSSYTDSTRNAKDGE